VLTIYLNKFNSVQFKTLVFQEINNKIIHRLNE
jgi:hypothetical protein